MGNIKEAISFLELCKKISKKTILNTDKVYDLLRQYNLSDSDIRSNEYIKAQHYFSEWNSFLENKKNIDVYNWKKGWWVGFDSLNRYDLYSDYDHKFIKIYISLDREHLCEGVKRIFSFIEKENINHTSKATSIVRADNIIIRIAPNDYDGLKKIIDYINNDSYLLEGMNDVNPFIPTIGKIGVMDDDGRSYNEHLAEVISKYINMTKVFPSVNFKMFYKFVLITKKNDPLFIEMFNQAFEEENKYNKYVGKDNNVRVVNHFNNYDKKTMFELAVINTFEKHNKKQAVGAILESIKGDYSCFSNKGKINGNKEFRFRDYLNNNINAEEIKKIIFENNISFNNDSLEEIVKNYVDSIIYKYKGIYLEEAIKATALKYEDSVEDIIDRVVKYIKYEEANYFSSKNEFVRPNYNFRNAIKSNMSPKEAFEVIESILYNNGKSYIEGNNLKNVSECAKIIIKSSKIK